jgi:hypothetical protein
MNEKGKYMKYVSFPWPPLEAEMTIFNFSFLLKRNFFEKDSIKMR